MLHPSADPTTPRPTGDANEFYVYLLKKYGGRPFYVGKGSTNRALSHVRRADRGARGRLPQHIRWLQAAGGTVETVIVKAWMTQSEALALEEMLIHALGPVILPFQRHATAARAIGLSSRTDWVLAEIGIRRRRRVVTYAEPQSKG